MNQVFISKLEGRRFPAIQETGNHVTCMPRSTTWTQSTCIFRRMEGFARILTLNYGARWEINPPANDSHMPTCMWPARRTGTPLPATPVVNRT